MKVKNVFFLVYFLCASYIGWAQDPVAIHLDETDGLPDVEFYSILEDSKGFVWLAADKGLYRYDGKTFKYYTHPDQESRSVFHLYEDDVGRIWCNNVAGQFFYVEDDVLHLYPNNSEKEVDELSFFYVEENILYISRVNSIEALNVEDNTQKYLYKPKSFPSRMAIPFIENDTIYMASDEGFGTLDTFLNYMPKITLNLEFESNSRKLVFKDDQSFYVALRRLSGNIIKRVNLETNTYTEITIPDQIKIGDLPIIKYEKGFLWMVTDDGLFKGVVKNDEFRIDQVFFEGQYITDMLHDRNGNLWITTLRDGVYVVPNSGLIKQKFMEDPAITAMTKYNDSILLFGTAKGRMIYYNVNTLQANKIVQFPRPTQVNSILHFEEENVSHISQWTASVIYNHNEEKAISSKSYSGSKALVKGAKNNVLMASFNVGAILNVDNNGREIERRALLRKRANAAFYSRRSKRSYVGYIDHLRSYDEFYDSRVLRDTLKPIFAVDIKETDDQTLWVATYNAGIYGFIDDEIAYHFTSENGLVSNDVTHLLPDGNNLWVVSDNGIQLLDGTSKKWQTLKSRDGLAPYRIMAMEIIGNTLFFGTSDGFYSVQRNKIFKNRPQASIYMQTVTIGDDEVPLEEEGYSVPYDKNRIQFSFHSNGFQSDRHTLYEYRLIGFDEDWKILRNGIESVTYNSLKPGDYVFEVTAKNAPEAQTGDIVRVPFSVKLPFWKEPLFVYFTLLFFLSFIGWDIWRRVHLRERGRAKEIQELAIEKQITDLRLENLRSQMNPHFIFNALNSIQEYIILNKKDLASDYLGKFADLIRAYLHHSTKGRVTIQEEIECLDMYLELEKLRFEDVLDYTIQAKGLEKVEGYSIPTMLIQPYVENAIKHGLLHKKGDRNLDILFEAYENEKTKLICTITDNGVGRARAKEYKANKERIHKAFATQANKERLDLINRSVPQNVGVLIEDLEDDFMQPLGTRVVLKIPLTKGS